MKTKHRKTTVTPAAATTTATGTADPAPAPVKTVKHHSLLDKHQLAQISLCNTLFGVASD